MRYATIQRPEAAPVIRRRASRLQPRPAPRVDGGGWLKTGALLGSLGGLSALVGLLVFGWWGLAIALAAVVMVATVGLQVPTSWVMRLHGALPLPAWRAPGLHHMVAELAARAGVPAPVLYSIPSALPNALTAGSGRQRAALAVTDGALRLLDRDELEGVLAHEVAHIRNRDVSIQQAAGTISRAVTAMLEIAIWTTAFAALLGGATAGRLLLLVMLGFAVPVLTRMINAALSRTREFAADAAAAELTGRPLALASALDKLSMSQRGWLGRWLTPAQSPPWLRSHPSTTERIRRLLELGGHRSEYERTAPPLRPVSRPALIWQPVRFVQPVRPWSGSAFS